MTEEEQITEEGSQDKKLSFSDIIELIVLIIITPFLLIELISGQITIEEFFFDSPYGDFFTIMGLLVIFVIIAGFVKLIISIYKHLRRNFGRDDSDKYKF